MLPAQDRTPGMRAFSDWDSSWQHDPGRGLTGGGGTYTVVRTRNPTQSKGSPPKKSDVASFCAVTRETFEDDMGAD